MATALSSNQAEHSYSWKNKCFNLLKSKNNPAATRANCNQMNELLKNRDEELKRLKTIEEKIMEIENELHGNNVSNKSTSSHVHDLKLYQLISRISFDLERRPNTVSGFVVGQPLKLFNFDTTKDSEEYISHCLWELIDSK